MIMEDGVECKKCSKCLRFKPLKDFYRDLRVSDGLYSACKSCCGKASKIKNRQKYYTQK